MEQPVAMKRQQHLRLLTVQDYSDRVIEWTDAWGKTIYYAWTPMWEGPVREDYPAAMADLNKWRGNG